MFTVYKILKIVRDENGMIIHTTTVGHYTCRAEAVELLIKINCERLFDDFGFEYWAHKELNNVRYWLEPIRVK